MVDRSWQFYEAGEIADNPRTHGWKFENAAQRREGTSDLSMTGDTCAWARLIGYWLSEGYTLSPQKRNGEERERVYYRVGISQKPSPTLENMRDALSIQGAAIQESTNQAGVVTLEVANKGLWEYLRRECGTNSHDKHIPRNLLDTNMEVRRVLLETLIEGDGGYANGQRTGGWRYSSVSKQLADDVMELALSLGYATSIQEEHGIYNNRPSVIWRVAIRDKRLGTQILPEHVNKEPYDGLIYCFALPANHIYITRRNGMVAIQGNTGNLATAKTVELPMMKMFQSYQKVWSDTYQDIDEIILEHANVSPDNWYIDRDFPAIAPADIIAAATALGQILQIMPDLAYSDDVKQIALMTLGINNPKEVIDALDKQAESDPSLALAKALKSFREVLKKE